MIVVDLSREDSPESGSGSPERGFEIRDYGIDET